jgi:hypothetical protein
MQNVLLDIANLKYTQMNTGTYSSTPEGVSAAHVLCQCLVFKNVNI